MSGRVTLIVYLGNNRESEHVFEGPAVCTVGRAPDCEIPLPANPCYADVSRHHCAFDIDPPAVRVRDLGSFNGTYVNGERIGQRPRNQSPEEVNLNSYPERELHDGDVVQVGSTLVRVGVAVFSEVAGMVALTS